MQLDLGVEERVMEESKKVGKKVGKSPRKKSTLIRDYGNTPQLRLKSILKIVDNYQSMLNNINLEINALPISKLELSNELKISYTQLYRKMVKQTFTHTEVMNIYLIAEKHRKAK